MSESTESLVANEELQSRNHIRASLPQTEGKQFYSARLAITPCKHKNYVGKEVAVNIR